MKIFQNNLNLKKNRNFYIIFLLLSILIHLLTINFQPVNDEYIFFKGADLILTFEKNNSKIFFEYNANTLGFSYLIALIKFLFPFLETSHIGKLLSIISIFFYAEALKILYIYFRPKVNFKILLLIVILNPLIWNYTFRGIPNPFSSAICLYTISKIIFTRNSYLKLFYMILFSIGVIVKPFNAILLLIIFHFFYFEKKITFKETLFLFSIFLSIILTYFIINYFNYGFYLTPDNYSNVFKPKLNNFIISFFTYIGFLFFASYPFFIKIIDNFCLNKKKYNFIFYIFVFLISLVISRKYNIFLTEMNFGFLSEYINQEIYELIIVFNNFLFFVCIFFIFSKNQKKINSKKTYLLISLILFFIFFMSFTHSAQRYILVLLPIFYLVFFKLKNIFLLQILSIISYLFLNIFIFINYYNNHKSISNIVNYLNDKNIIHETNPGYIGQHALNNFTSFYDEKGMIKKSNIFRNKKYIIKDYKNSDDVVIYETKNNIFGIKKNLFVIKIL